MKAFVFIYLIPSNIYNPDLVGAEAENGSLASNCSTDIGQCMPIHGDVGQSPEEIRNVSRFTAFGKINLVCGFLLLDSSEVAISIT